MPRQNGEASGKGPDPAEFEPEFVIADSEPPSRAGTPRPALNRSESSTKETARDNEEARTGDGQPEKPPYDDASATPQELPTDIRVKLRKLEKLESRYHELLRSYRIAHARVQTIDSFEASLRENTPLTSISDPRALVEYLNQLNLKGDIVLDELKRVSHDRDTYKEQLNDAERRAREAWDEVTSLQKPKGVADTNDDQAQLQTSTSAAGTSSTEEPIARQSPSGTAKSPPTSAKSRTGSLPSLSIFSPKSKPTESPVIMETREDLFSYDDEIPRLQSELKDRDDKIEELQTEVTSLQGDLAVTRESTSSMVQTLEEATRELNGLRDYKDRSAAELEEQRVSLEKLQTDLKAAETKVQDLEVVAQPSNAARVEELEEKVNRANDELQKLRGHTGQSEDQVDEAQKLQEQLISLEKALGEAEADRKLSDKKADTAASLVRTLRGQVAEVEEKHAEDEKGREESEQTLLNRILELERHLGSQQIRQDPVIENLSKKIPAMNASQAQHEPSAQVTDMAIPGKKKNKKKKKGGKGEQTKEAQPDQSEPVSIGTSKVDQGIDESVDSVKVLQDELHLCRRQLEERGAALETMRSKLKEQDDLKEEIESLRDDLINVGQGHVQAKERVKELQAEKQALQDTVSRLEKEITELQALNASETASSNEQHQDLAARFEELNSKAITLQTDLSAAQQLASSRFKELSELRAVMQKAQPELTCLRSEVGELRPIKEAHDKMEVALKQAESRQEQMRTEMATQKGLMAERDAEIEHATRRLDQESSSRCRAEEARDRASEEVQRLETEKRQAAEGLDKLSRDLSKARDEIRSLRSRQRDMEQQMTALKRDRDGLKEEMELKTAQHASAQSLMSSMRDQTTELAVQMKEARDRCESLEEEIADAHRLLGERSREGETMRRLLADIEGKADARVREMKERMDTAIEERDRAEDEASTAARRRARELDDLRNRVREAERSMKRAEEDKEELETAQRDWKRRREELEHRSEQSTHEVEEVRRAMGELRNALDESERQVRAAEKQKAAVEEAMEDTRRRVERLQKSNKVRPEMAYRAIEPLC